MAEDPRTTQRNMSPAKSGVQVIKSFRSYIKSWRYETTSATGVVSDDSSSQVRSYSRTWSRQTTLETREVPSRRPTECIFLFPGWAVRRYHGNSKDKFDLHVHVSGYATTQRPTRGQGTIFRIAKRYAALHKVAESQNQKSSSGRSRTASVDCKDSKDDELLEKLNETYNQALENVEVEAAELPYEDTPPSTGRPSRLGALQANLEERMELLLGHSMIPSRHVDLELFVSEHPPAADGDDPKVATKKGSIHPVGRHVICTDGNGMFHHDFVINWDKICHHPAAHYQHGEIVKECELLLHANLLASSFTREGQAINREEQTIPITHAPIRVISDIDDTIKLSNILGGARSVFRNVFVHDFEDIKIPGMSEWYNSMWEEGVRFHYVSNGPVQLLPLIKAFLHASKLPLGSIRLKAYGARSIFSDLLTPPADRKREGLDKILDCFPDSKFILIGDSGEQDLELYAQVAQLRPNQILAVLVRDVEPDVDAIPDPIGKEWRRSAVSRKNSDTNSVGGSSRSNSVFSSAIRDRLANTRQKSWSSSLFNAPPFPPKRSGTCDDLSDAQDLPATSPSSPPVSEPEQMSYGDDSGAAGPIHFRLKGSSSSPNSRLSSSPLSVSILSQSLGAEEGELPPSPSRQSHPNGTASRIARRTTLETQDEEEDCAPLVLTADQQEQMLSQSPEAEVTGVLGSTSSRVMGAGAVTSPKPSSKSISFNPTHPESSLQTRSRPSSSSGSRNPMFGRPSQHRVQTADEAMPTRSPWTGGRPWAPRRNTTTPSSETGTSPGAGANSPLTSPSKLSLTSRYRGMSESERKRAELQDRVWSARAKIPEHVVLRIFRNPGECAEAGALLKGGLSAN